MCGLTDLELSGAPQLADREADRARPTRPLERLVRRLLTGASQFNLPLRKLRPDEPQRASLAPCAGDRPNDDQRQEEPDREPLH